MTKMTIIDVVNIAYPGQLSLGNVTFGEDTDNNIFITSWNVPNQPEPSVDSLLAQMPALQSQFDLSYFVTNGTLMLSAFVDSVAQQKQYDDGVSCASYVTSTVVTWAAQAVAFIGWRDSVYNYAIAQELLMQSGSRTIPTFTEFLSELPVIAWPT